jgi:hypothetical protein
VLDAAMALIELSTTTVTATSNVTTTRFQPPSSTSSVTTTRFPPTPISYQDIVSSLNRSSDSNQGIRTRPARRRGGRGRPTMPRLPAAAFRSPNTSTTPSLQITMSTDPDTREVRIQHNVNLPSLGNEDFVQ